MKFAKILATSAAAAVAVSALAVSAFADIDYTAVAEANNGLLLKASAGWAGGQWIVGSDNVVMENPLTIEDLENADHFEIYYTSTEAPPTLTEGDTAKLTFCYKVVTAEDEEGKPSAFEAYLPDGWYQYGPTTPEDGSEPANGLGHSFHSIEYFSYDVKSEGIMIVKTADIIASLEIDASEFMYISQFGIGNNIYDYDSDWTDEAELGADYNVTVSKVLLCDEPTDASIAAEQTTAETTVAEDTTVLEETDAEATPEAADETTESSTPVDGLPTLAIIAIVAGAVVVVAVIVIIAVTSKKKK